MSTTATDYYVVYGGTTSYYDTYAEGLAAAKALGSDAIYYVDAMTSASTHTYCQGVNVVFSGGIGKTSGDSGYVFRRRQHGFSDHRNQLHHC